jgi:hypothetical protein
MPKSILHPYLVLLPMGFSMAPFVTKRAVRSYRTLSPLPSINTRFSKGGLLSVALIPGVTPAGHYPASLSMEPGLSSRLSKNKPAIA